MQHIVKGACSTPQSPRITDQIHSSDQNALVLFSKEQHLQRLMKDARSICEYIHILNYHSSTNEGEQILFNEGVIMKVHLPKRDAFLVHRNKLQSEFAKDRLDFQELYSIKTMSKLDLFGNTMRVGNCGEKTAHAFLSLLKYYPEEIRSIEEIRIANPQKETDHLFLVLNRAHSDIQLDPMHWRPIDDQTDVVIVDPSFNTVFLAREYQGKLMMYEDAQINHSQEYACNILCNFYTPYQPDPRKYSIATHKRFDIKNPNQYFLEYMKDHTAQSPEMLDIKREEKELREQFQLWVTAKTL